MKKTNKKTLKDATNEKKALNNIKENKKNTEKKAKSDNAHQKNKPTSAKTPESRKKRLKKIIIIVLACLWALAAIFFILKLILKSKESPLLVEVRTDLFTTSFDNYSAVDYDVDIFKDAEYLEKNREIMYSGTNGTTYSLSSIPENQLHEGHLFFKEYFDIAISGDYKKYPELFTQMYKDTPVGFERTLDREFPPQRIYNISVKEISRTTGDNVLQTHDGRECEYGMYVVEFNILKNDGMFRRDFQKGASRPLIFELVTFNAGEKNQKTLIRNVYTEDTALQAARNNSK